MNLESGSGGDVPTLLEEIENALVSGDSATSKRAAHSIKGLASSFEAERVMRHALVIENLASDGKLDLIPEHLPALRSATTELMAAFDELDCQ